MHTSQEWNQYIFCKMLWKKMEQLDITARNMKFLLNNLRILQVKKVQDAFNWGVKLLNALSWIPEALLREKQVCSCKTSDENVYNERTNYCRGTLLAAGAPLVPFPGTREGFPLLFFQVLQRQAVWSRRKLNPHPSSRSAPELCPELRQLS